jgi:hypothetical protein
MNAAIQAILEERPAGVALLRAIQTFLERDNYLLRLDVNERSITSLIARYLAPELPDYHVDCEYNRDGVNSKRIGHLGLNPDEEDTEARTVFPDIIAHHRGTNEHNYLVVEVKKSTNSASRNLDRIKLAGFKRDLGYSNAVFVELLAGGQSGVSHVEWI